MVPSARLGKEGGTRNGARESRFYIPTRVKSCINKDQSSPKKVCKKRKKDWTPAMCVRPHTYTVPHAPRPGTDGKGIILL